jgi:hypothetical protein
MRLRDDDDYDLIDDNDIILSSEPKESNDMTDILFIDEISDIYITFYMYSTIKFGETIDKTLSGLTVSLLVEFILEYINNTDHSQKQIQIYSSSKTYLINLYFTHVLDIFKQLKKKHHFYFNSHHLYQSFESFYLFHHL